MNVCTLTHTHTHTNAQTKTLDILGQEPHYHRTGTTKY